MNTNTKTIYLWIIGVLLTINIATVGRIIYLQKQASKIENPAVIMGADGTAFRSEYFRCQMNFDSLQMARFEAANAVFKPTTRDLILILNDCKFGIAYEIKQPQVDTVQLNFLAEKIGKTYCELNRTTINFYLNLHNICRQDQHLILDKIFNALFLAAPNCPNMPCLHSNQPMLNPLN